MLRSNLIARVVSSVSSNQGKRVFKLSRILIVLVTVLMVMSSGEPAYAGWCPKC